MSQAANGFSRLQSVNRDAKRVAAVMIVALGIGAFSVAAGTPDWKTAWVGLLWAIACSAGAWFLGFLFGIRRSLSSDPARTALPGAQSSALPMDRSKTRQRAKATRNQLSAMKQSTAQPSTVRSLFSTSTPGRIGPQQSKPPSNFGVSRTMQRSKWPTAVNTNLEQISNWITKIIVGVTLVESKELIKRLEGCRTCHRSIARQHVSGFICHGPVELLLPPPASSAAIF